MRSVLSVIFVMSAMSAQAQVPVAAARLDCNALANSMGSEPEGYAEQCASSVPLAYSAPLAPHAPTDLAFTLDIRGQVGVPTRLANSLYNFTLNAFATQNLRGVSNPQIFGLDFDPTGVTLFGVTATTAAPNPLTLGTINTTTGAFTPIAAITGLTAGDSPSGLTINPITGAAFLSAPGGTPTLSRLYSLDLTTAVATLIGQITAPTDPAGTLMIDIAMNCDGQIFAHNIADDSLYSVNPTTGAGTLIGAHGLAANFAQGMDFDNQDGTLYAFIYTGGGTNRFGSFNLATGAFTTLVQDNPLGEYEGAIPTTCFPPVVDDIFGNGFEDVVAAP
jgi:hypothetical protein